MAPESENWRDGELAKLREWRHDVATPTLVTLGVQVAQLRKEVDEIRPRVEAIARADEIADAVTAHIKASRSGLLTTGEKLGGALVGLAAVASVIAQFVH